VRLFFEGPCAKRCVLVDGSSADASLVDMDSFGAAEIWQAHRKCYPERPAIVLSLDPGKAMDGLFVQKPVKASDFLAVLDVLDERLGRSSPAPTEADACAAPLPEEAAVATQRRDDRPDARGSSTAVSRARRDAEATQPRQGKSRYATPANAQKAAMQFARKVRNAPLGSIGDIDTSDPAQLHRVYYDPQRYLQGHLRRAFDLALEKGRPVRLTGAWRPITVYPDRREVFLEMSDAQLRGICYAPVAESAVRLSVLSVAEEKNDASRTPQDIKGFVPMEALLWNVALWCCRGRLPSGTGLNLPVYLRRWPSLTRVVVPAHALSIAALWMRDPHTLLRTTELLSIPQSDVFTFYSAAYAVGLAGEARRQADQVIEPQPVAESRSRSLLKRLLTRLNIRTAD
jgi:hypothetical protein